MGMELDLQKLHYFTADEYEGNEFTGSCTKDREQKILLRYAVKPDLENQLLLAFAWTQDVCFEKAVDKQEKQFPMTSEGHCALRDWLQARYNELP